MILGSNISTRCLPIRNHFFSFSIAAITLNIVNVCTLKLKEILSPSVIEIPIRAW